jgi:GxxExxY protein
MYIETTRVQRVARTEPTQELNKLSWAVVDAAIEVHRHLGLGFFESVYEEALSVELASRNIPFARQPVVPIYYKDHPIGEGRLDLLVGGCLIIELKAVEALAPIHTAQVISYLKATGFQLGLLINFNVPILKSGLKRIINSK